MMEMTLTEEEAADLQRIIDSGEAKPRLTPKKAREVPRAKVLAAKRRKARNTRRLRHALWAAWWQPIERSKPVINIPRYDERTLRELGVLWDRLPTSEPIVLSDEGFDRLLGLLDNPPEPNEALKRAFERYRETVSP